MRKNLLQQFSKDKLPFVEGEITIENLEDADEVFYLTLFIIFGGYSLSATRNMTTSILRKYFPPFIQPFPDLFVYR